MNQLQLEYQYTVGGYVTFTVRVRSGEFAGAADFCLPCRTVETAVCGLKALYETLQGEYEIRDTESDDYLRFESRPYGHFLVSGQLGGSFNAQYLKFELPIDQTDLGGMRKELVRFLRMGQQ